MAHTATHSNILTTPARAIAAFASSIFEVLIRIGEANSRVRRIEALYALSDNELAQRGLRRENIIREVMHDFV